MSIFKQLLAIFVSLLLTSLLYAEERSHRARPESTCPQASDAMILLVDKSIYNGLKSEVETYISDVCNFQNYSVVLRLASSAQLKYLEDVSEIIASNSKIRGIFFVGNFEGEKTSLLPFSKKNANWKDRVRYNLIKGLFGTIFLDDLVVYSNLGLELPKQTIYDHADRIILGVEPKDIILDQSYFTAKLPLGGVENVDFYQNYFKKIAEYRRKSEIPEAPNIYIFRDIDPDALEISNKLIQKLERDFSTQQPRIVTQTSFYLRDSQSVYQNAVMSKLSTPHLASFFFFHGSELNVNQWNPFQKVLNMTQMESNSRISISIACSVSEDETNESGFVFKSLTTGSTLNVIAGRGLMLSDETLFSDKFVLKFFGHNDLIGPSFKYFVDHRDGIGQYPISFVWNKSVSQLYGDPLLPL